jgi:hypothetical protein
MGVQITSFLSMHRNAMLFAFSRKKNIVYDESNGIDLIFSMLIFFLYKFRQSLHGLTLKKLYTLYSDIDRVGDHITSDRAIMQKKQTKYGFTSENQTNC